MIHNPCKDTLYVKTDMSLEPKLKIYQSHTKNQNNKR